MDTRTVILKFIIVFSSTFYFVGGVPYRLFYPYGADRDDVILQPGDDSSSNEVQLKTPISFYDGLFSSIFVNTNGFLSFETEIPDFHATALVLPVGYKVIAGFMADIDTRSSGTIFYRESEQQALLQRAAADIQTHFSEFTAFEPTSLFVATWDSVGYYERNSSHVNTFQIVIASDGVDSFTFFHYLDDGIRWIRGRGKSVPVARDPPAQAGFDSGAEPEKRRHLKLPYSGTLKIGQIAQESNINVAGVWMYHIGNTKGGNVRGADLNTGDVTIFDVEAEESTCLEGAKRCNLNARCIDFDEGFCCECVAPHYGNGIQCLGPGAPQRLNGKVTGTINGVTLDSLDMHSYVVTSDGRAYTAISRVPEGLGVHLLTLNTIGGIIGWLFAVVNNPRAYNGYMFTGGEFNRTSTIKYQGGETVLVRQRFFGHDALNNLRMETHISGTVPDIPDGNKVTIDDYKEEYRRVSPGTIKSYSSRTYRVNEVAYRYTWDQAITFKECEHDHSRAISDTMRLSVIRNFVVYDDLDQVVRFAMSNKIGILTGVDPCRDADQNCDQYADCIPFGDAYRCECHPGFVGDGRSCQDIDECSDSLNVCDANAECYNVIGSFQCQCLAGYRGDGRVCQRDTQLCGTSSCDANGRCVFNSDMGQPMCECKPGYAGNGIECFPIEFGCNEVDICHEDAECVLDPEGHRYTCECVEGYSGDGISCARYDIDPRCLDCDPNSQCIYDLERFVFRCQCNAGFTGDGTYCSPISSPEECERCHPNAQCYFDDRNRRYECRCSSGFYGDGYRCQPLDCRSQRICDANAECLEVAAGQFQCRCRTGYRGDGRRCESEGCNIVNDCAVNAQCLPDPRDTSRYICRCNRGYDGDGRTCDSRVTGCNQVDNCSEFAECIYDPNALSYRCRCRPGYEGDGFSCRPRGIDCRRDPRLCDQNAACVVNVDVFACSCNRGYEGDGRVCYPVTDGNNYLLFARGDSIQRTPFVQSPENEGSRVLYLPGQLAVGIDTDCLQRQMYWTDAIGGKVNRAEYDGSNSETLVTGLSSPEGVAIDWIARNMYWTDSGLNMIMVAHLDGTNKKRLFANDLVNPRAIIVDPSRGYMYWSDWNRGAPKIEHGHMDGSNREVLVETDLGLPNGLTIDYQTQQVCWGDAGVRKVECVRTDGVGRRVITEDAPYPFDVAFFGNEIFWSDWTIIGISSIHRNGGSPEAPLDLPIGGNGRLYGITVVREQCPRVSNACQRNNGGCRFLCLPTPRGGRTCACPEDIDQDRCNEIAEIRKKKK